MTSPMFTGPATSSAQRRSSRTVAARLGANLLRVNARRAPLADLYHQLLNMPWAKFVALIVGGYFFANVVFATIYWSIPNGIQNAHDFWDHFFFSVQTWATIGYGGMVPHGRLSNTVVVVESLVGIFMVAMLTGLFFAKFSRASSRVLFADRAVISVRNGKPVLMMRVANERGNFIVEATAHVTLLRDETTREGERMRRMYDLPLVRQSSPFFILSWSIMHEIDERSPLHDYDQARLEKEGVRLAVNLVGYDSSVGQMTHASHLYMGSEILHSHRYLDATYTDADGRSVLDYARFHDVEPTASPPSA